MKTRLFPLLAAALLLVPPGTSSAQTAAAYAWGLGGSGQLGNGTTTGSSVPVQVTGLTSGVTTVAAGGSHSLAIRNGTVLAWGDNQYGELGNGTSGTMNNSSVPVQVTGLGGTVTAVAAGADHSLTIQNGAVLAWGSGGDGQLGNGDSHLGTSTASYYSTVPVQVTGLTSGVTAISAGFGYSLAIQNGAVLAWGFNNYGQLGNGTTTRSYVPAQVTGLTSGVTAVSAGSYHNLAIQNGAILAWGNNDHGQLGVGTTTRSSVPIAVTGLTSGVTGIAVGYQHSLAVRDGKVFAWGSNEQGQLGDGTHVDSRTPFQVDPAHLTNIVAVAAGTSSSYTLASDGSLWVWGNGPLGLGNNYQFATPQHLLPPDGYRYSAIAAKAFAQHVVAVLDPFTVPSFFNGQTALSNGVYYLAFPSGFLVNRVPFGYYAFLSDPKYIFHFDLGYEYVFDAADGKSGVYFYDFASGSFFYTSPTFPFPYLYDFTLNTVLYYYPDPNSAGHYNTNGVRYFYRFDTGQIFSK